MTTPTSTPPTSHSPDRAQRVRRVGNVVALGALVALAAVSYTITRAATADDGAAELIVVQDVPADVRHELDDTWARFVDHFAARTECFDDVAVELVRAVDGGDARYVVAPALIEIEIPTTPARFRESLLHELAHHVEHSCREFADLQRVLHPMLGGTDRPWAGGDDWAEIPSERWAEAVVELVNGERILHAEEMPIDPGVIEVIGAWGRGR